MILAAKAENPDKEEALPAEEIEEVGEEIEEEAGEHDEAGPKKQHGVLGWSCQQQIKYYGFLSLHAQEIEWTADTRPFS